MSQFRLGMKADLTPRSTLDMGWFFIIVIR